MVVTIVVVFIVVALLVTACVSLFLKYRALRFRFADVLSADDEVQKAKEAARVITDNAHDEVRRAAQEVERNKGEAHALNGTYIEARALYDRLKSEIDSFEGSLEDISFGLYKPHYDFQSSDQYREHLDKIRDQQKAILHNGSAASCSVQWNVGGSSRDGARMQKQYTKLMLRAFNGECDAVVARVSWNNATRMEERIKKAFDAINDLGGVMQISLTKDYLGLKIDELRLEFEYEEKKHAEVEEQRRIKDQMREEAEAQRELEKAKEEAEAEETRFQKALDKARADVAKAKGEQLAKLNERIAQLAERLQEAQEMKQRAVSRAQLTKSGHVYIISNVGSFGENVVKIGMTRRLEPVERVKELGNASVPFPFDVHAMVYSEDAPALENELHRFFHSKRVNQVNVHKEYFTATLQEIEGFVSKKNLPVQVTKLAEAREYRETLALRAKNEAASAAPTPPPFPAQLQPVLPVMPKASAREDQDGRTRRATG